MLDTRENPDKPGRIFPPLVEIEYSEVNVETDDNDKEKSNVLGSVSLEYDVSYKVDMKEAKKDIEIAMGVLSVFAVLWSAKGTWAWSRRSGKMAADPMTLVKVSQVMNGNKN